VADAEDAAVGIPKTTNIQTDKFIINMNGVFIQKASCIIRL
jgi:hypothetical protein